MDYKISLLTVAEQPIAAARQRTTFKMVSREIQGLLSGPWTFVRAHPGLWTSGCNVAIYWDPPAEGSIEVGIQVTSRFEGSGEVVCSSTPAARVAMTSHFGPYSELGAAHKAVRLWCREHGHALLAPHWEVYGHWNDDPAKLRTDVYYRLG
jgi:effector-binding domain-containing protein